ncbi:glycosyltransferase [Rarobacter faecitabidus]|uniref:Glycosyltransferase involved in cell wall biosynthesis n=1 Tax=Rarobacter faecitabidus TaxID=13243 RepID=A0A542ZW29_RARFA|nr:glycosyltransferase [Rarobacter faecitabidus]TQL64565.1 glycosyltransferase involved in cell wall biosynthesis [Rarobacter faecitabidus]
MTPAVLIVVGRASGGVAQQVGMQVRALHERGIPVEVWGPHSTLDSLGGIPSQVQTQVVDVGERPALRDVATVRRLRRAWSRFAVVHAHGARAGALAALASVGINPAVRRTRFVVTLHNRPIGSRPVRFVGWLLVWLVAQRGDAVLAVSPDLVRRVKVLAAGRYAFSLVARRHRPLVDLAIVAAPIPVDEVPASLEEARRRATATRYVLEWPQDEFIVATVARLAPQKGLDSVISAAIELAQGAFSGRRWRWLVIGDGPLRAQLEAAARDSGVAANVEFLGRRSDAVTLMRLADIVVSPALWEGQSVAIMEALGVGAALVATDVGGTRGVTGRAARLVAPARPDALADQIAAVASSTMLTDQLRTAAIRRARTLPRVPQLLDQLRRAYDSTI